MTVVVNEVRRGTYLDSVALMRIAEVVRGMDGVEEAGLMIGTPANLEVLAEAGVLADEGRGVGPGDVVLAVRARTREAAEAALARARHLIDQRQAPVGGVAGAGPFRPRSLRSAVGGWAPSLAVISVPGPFAAAEAQKALAAGLDVLIFSDNVAIDDEIALKREAARRGRLVMGPDCGTAIIGGVPIAFANAVPAGDIGIVGASGTGIQEVSCLVAMHGRGISHAIGTGGRDLDARVGALTALAAIDLLDTNPATRHLVVVSKPPAPEVAARVLERIGLGGKPATVCFVGGEATGLVVPSNARLVCTLAEAAAAACGKAGPEADAPMLALRKAATAGRPRGPLVAGLFAGGTLAAEAQVVLMQRGLQVRSNAPVPGAAEIAAHDLARGHTLIDLGDDDYTRGRPHPMIEPAVRDAPIREAAADPRTGVILLDLVLGFGAHPDPAGHIAGVIGSLPRKPTVIASVTGTDADPQNRRTQVATLEAAGIQVAPSNAAAARSAVAAVRALRA